MGLTPFFLDTGAGQRFCIHHPAHGGAAKASVLYLHPFAEEMNKSRRMAALQARALARSGCSVLQVDFGGCGDSCGDFGNASWQGWIDDAIAGARWLQQRDDRVPFWLWGLRAGCLIATATAARLGEPCNLLLWQPTLKGKTALQQFLRVGMAGGLAAGSTKDTGKTLREKLARELTVEIAGYRLNASLARDLDAATLQAPPQAQRIEWLEVSSAPQPMLLPASAQIIADWTEAGHSVHSQIVCGPPFWQTSEISEAPALIDHTLASLLDEAAPA